MSEVEFTDSIRQNDLDNLKVVLKRCRWVAFREKEALPFCVKNNRIEMATVLIKYGADLEYLDGLPLIVATDDGSKPEMLELLLKMGANVHSRRDGAIRVALANFDFEKIGLLLKYGADIHEAYNELLLFSARFGVPWLSEISLERGDGWFKDGALELAVKNRHSKVVEKLLQNGGYSKSSLDAGLICAAEKGDKRMLDTIFRYYK